MKRTTRTTPKNLILVCGLLGVMVTSQALAADIRYKASGDYFVTTNDTANANGWQWPYIPDWEHTIRLNWGGEVGNTVTLNSLAPDVLRFQFGVGESGHLIINDGGSLTSSGATGGSFVGNNGGSNRFGRITVNAGGYLRAMTAAMQVGAGAMGIITNDGGTVTVDSHLWVGSGNVAGVTGTIVIKNGGVFNVGSMIGLGTVNATAPSGNRGFVYVQTNGVLNLANIQAAASTNLDGSANSAYLGSIQPNSRLDITGNGLVTLPNDFTNVINNYVAAGRITAYGGLGTVAVDLVVNEFDVTNTWITAIAPFLPTNTVWNPAGNPSGTGKWNEATNWTSSVVPADVTKVTFNVDGAIPCTVTNAANAKYVTMGDGGPGGTLIITNGGSLTCTADNWSAIGYNSNALMVVESGGSASFGSHLWIGLNTNSDAMLTMNGGTVSVAGMFGLGWSGGKGTANINGGILNLSQWQVTNSIQGASVLNVAGNGMVVITGNHVASITNFVSSGKITANGGTGTVGVDYGNLNVGKTTLYVVGAYVPPAQVIWSPAGNPSSTGKWSESANWNTLMVPTNVTKVIFNVEGAIPCTVTNAAFASQVVMGDDGPGGTLIVANGGSLTGTGDWSAVGYESNSVMVVESGASASFGNHLWVGFNPGAVGTLTLNGGTVTVAGAFGLGFNGGQGFVNVNNGGTLNLAQLGTGRIQGASVLDIVGTGKVVINGDATVSVGAYVSGGQITASGTANVLYSYDAGTGKTTVTSGAALPPPPRQSITGVTVSGGNVSLTYETTAGYTYYIEQTPTLSPTAWTPVAGSTNAASGVPVTFDFPVGLNPMFYRTVTH
jgi:hypothetical protein